MPELRKDPITQEWVIIATERARRPSDFTHLTIAAHTENAFLFVVPNHPLARRAPPGPRPRSALPARQESGIGGA